MNFLENDKPGQNVTKINSCLEDLLIVFQKHKLTLAEILLAYGNLGYQLGCNIDGYEVGPKIEDIEQKYYESPTLGTALMLQGLIVTSWTEGPAQVKNQKGEKNYESSK